MIPPKDLKQKAAGKKEENKKFFASLKSRSKGDLDREFHELHDEVFSEIDCLECANCCKTTSPIITDRDIDRMAHELKMKPGVLIEKYLQLDSDQDYVFRTAPCPMLNEDNACSIYDARPKACREYPHTNRRHMHEILNLTRKNTEVCPAVYEIVERMKRS